MILRPIKSETQVDVAKLVAGACRPIGVKGGAVIDSRRSYVERNTFVLKLPGNQISGICNCNYSKSEIRAQVPVSCSAQS